MSEPGAEAHDHGTGEIVVGLDDSPAGRSALRWAAHQARLTGAPLRAVAIADWPTGVTADGQVLLDGLVYLPDEETTAAYQGAIRSVFETVDPEPGWGLVFEQGKPGQVLVREAGGARLLVVGTGEHVGLGRFLIGSTSHYCLSHAPCPVVAVPSRESADRD